MLIKQEWRHMMRGRLEILRQSSFLRSVTVLVGGTAFGQAVAILVLPLLTRLYSPQDFSILAVYSGLLGILSVVACLRFDIAIPLPERETDALNLMVLALSLAILVSALLCIPAFLFPQQVGEMLKAPGLQPYLWILPIGVLLTSSYSALQFWATRKKHFPLIARTRVSQSLIGAATQTGLGALGQAPLGLLLGQTFNSGAGALGLGWKTLRASKGWWHEISITEMRRLFQRYDRFPKFSTLEAFANTAAIQVPVLIIAAAALGPEAGYLALAMRVMQIPMGLIGGAIGQVFLSRAPEEHREGRLGIFAAGILGGLLRTGVGPLAFAGIVAPDAFALIFGSDWQRAGTLVTWMTPWFIFQFLASPLSMALHVTHSQRQAFLLQVFGLVVRVSAVVVALALFETAVSEAYAVSGFGFYAIYLVLVLRVSTCPLAAVWSQTVKSLPFILPWCLGGFVFQYLFGIVAHGFH